MPSGDAQIEAAPGAASQRRGDQPVSISGDKRIGVKEEQGVSGAELQRRRSTARRGLAVR